MRQEILAEMLNAEFSINITKKANDPVPIFACDGYTSHIVSALIAGLAQATLDANIDVEKVADIYREAVHEYEEMEAAR
ncbi:MAG: hypothetical protein LUD84_09675 [Clostridiales bacterium]|nr:hypothetical protein [Clostridiales bacterium]